MLNLSISKFTSKPPQAFLYTAEILQKISPTHHFSFLFLGYLKSPGSFYSREGNVALTSIREAEAKAMQGPSLVSF